MLKIIWYARKQGCFVVLPVVFLWHAGGWNSTPHRGNTSPVVQVCSAGLAVRFSSVVLNLCECSLSKASEMH